MYHGDIRLGDTIDIKFCTTAAATGAPTTLSGTPVISAYPGNSTTQLTAGITLSVDFDSVTGLNNVRVVATSGNGYATATNYVLVVTTGTVGGTSAVGYCIGSFSIEARSAVMPTTAARTLDVSAGGEAGIDWANIGSPTTAVNLSATNIDVDQVVASVSGAVGSVSAGVTLANNAITAAATAADFTTEIQAGLATAAALATAQVDLDAIDAKTTNLPSDPADQSLIIAATNAIVALIGTPAGASVSADIAALPTAAENADQVWDEALAGHIGAGSTGAALNAAGAAGDPWTIALPGAYGAGTAGFIVGTNLDATVSSVKAKTDNLPAAPAAVGDIPTAVQNADALLGRNVAGGSSAGRTVKEALYVLRNKTDIAGGTLTVYGTDDATPAFTAGVTTSPGDPISAIDPA